MGGLPVVRYGRKRGILRYSYLINRCRSNRLENAETGYFYMGESSAELQVIDTKDLDSRQVPLVCGVHINQYARIMSLVVE
jgi:hypothetical protein